MQDVQAKRRRTDIPSATQPAASETQPAASETQPAASETQPEMEAQPESKAETQPPEESIVVIFNMNQRHFTMRIKMVKMSVNDM